MNEVTKETPVLKREDAWVEVYRHNPGTDYAVTPLQLRPGSAADKVIVSENSLVLAEVKIADLRRALELIEEEHQR